MGRLTHIAVACVPLAACGGDETASTGATGGGSASSAMSASSTAGAGGGASSIVSSSSTSSGTGGGPVAPFLVSCAPVATASPDGYFTLRSFGDRLYAGLFGYGMEGTSMLYSYPPYGQVQPGLTGISESVCAMIEHDGMLYANTESSGDIFRSADGASWTRVYDGQPNSIGCGLAVHGGAIYAVNYDNQGKENGRILRSTDGASFTSVYDSGAGVSRYLRDIVSYGGELLAFAVNENNQQGSMLRSADGAEWAETPTPARFFRSYVHGDTLWLSSAAAGSNGVAGIWRYDDGTPTLVHTSDKRYVTQITSYRGALFAATSDGWKGDTGKASLLVSFDHETWATACPLGQLAAWTLEPHGDKLYVATWEFGKGGSLYEVAPLP